VNRIVSPDDVLNKAPNQIQGCQEYGEKHVLDPKRNPIDDESINQDHEYASSMRHDIVDVNFSIWVPHKGPIQKGDAYSLNRCYGKKYPSELQDKIAPIRAVGRAGCQDQGTAQIQNAVDDTPRGQKRWIKGRFRVAVESNPKRGNGKSKHTEL
jgi:hypothetical protein